MLFPLFFSNISRGSDSFRSWLSFQLHVFPLFLCHSRFSFVIPAFPLSFPHFLCHSREGGNPDHNSLLGFFCSFYIKKYTELRILCFLFRFLFLDSRLRGNDKEKAGMTKKIQNDGAKIQNDGVKSQNDGAKSQNDGAKSQNDEVDKGERKE